MLQMFSSEKFCCNSSLRIIQIKQFLKCIFLIGFLVFSQSRELLHKYHFIKINYNLLETKAHYFFRGQMHCSQKMLSCARFGLAWVLPDMTSSFGREGASPPSTHQPDQHYAFANFFLENFSSELCPIPIFKYFHY